MDFIIKLIYITLIFSTTDAITKSYKDYKVYKINPVTENDVVNLSNLKYQGKHAFWNDIIRIGSDVRIMVDPEKRDQFEEYMKNVDIELKIVIEDIQSLIDNQLKQNNDHRNGNEFGWDRYHTLEEIYDWLNEIANTYPNIITPVTIGVTAEGRVIRGIKINYKDNNNITAMIEGGIHAREWISPATVTWIIKELLTSTDPNVRLMAENIVWHIFPVTNPDGYSYTFTNDRMWRKNRNPANNGSCAQWNINDDQSNGIDLNRNFGFLWMTTGASQLPCSEVYAGPEAFSELESQAISRYVRQIQNEGNLIYYIAFHSFSQMVLVPYSHVSGPDVLEASNYGDMFEIAIRGAEKLKQRHGTDYVVGTSADILYEVSGSSFDWVKGEAHVPVVYLLELRDVGEYGFLLPPELIIPNNEEIMDSLIEMERVTRQLNYYTADSNNVYSSVILILCALFFVLY